jgi:predicted PurR-regulated permease PerM
MPGIDPRALRVVWTVFLFVLAAGVAYLIRRTLVVFVLALFLAQLLSPVVDLVERFAQRRASRTAALVTVYLALLGAAAAILAPVTGRIVEEASALAGRLPQVIQSDPLANLPLPSWLETYRPRITETLRQQMADLDTRVLPVLTDAGRRLLSGLGNLLSAILIPILSFFLLKDGHAIHDALLENFSGRARRTAAAILDDLHTLLAQYTRALLLLAVATFVSHFAFLSLAGVPYAILLAGIAGVLEFIPVVGPLAAAMVMLLVAAFAGYPHLLWIVIFLVVYRMFQDYVLSPHLMSAGVAVHPLVVLFGVLAGEQAAGIPGMFFAVPLLAALRIVAVRLREGPVDA